ncbi:MAG: hypothetical protein FIA95_06590, partial [Gemmatimonadetes bacterium]|nr:hypothetical protein [Gemmatimonadota bacterium]
MIRNFLPALAVGTLLWPAPAAAQSIAFKTDLPRTLVFIQEDGRSQVASREMTAFLREAGFPVIDPALAHEAAQRELVRAAMEGDEGAATELGRDFGAQVLILGVADWGARPDPVDGSLITGTTEVSVRALRLDLGTVVSDGLADARVIEATEQAAKSKAVRQATQEILNGGMIGKLINDWESAPWQEAGYWKPDPGSIPASAQPAAGGGEAPGLAIIRADVLPAQGTATRGIGVVKK